MFTRYPSYNYFRTLRLAQPILAGEDVYALQIALNQRLWAPNGGVKIDGYLGPQTARAIEDAQGRMSLTVDGLAGPATQRQLAQFIANESIKIGKLKVPQLLAKGTLMTESGGYLGAYSPQRANGSFDAGVVQRNTDLTGPREGFDPVRSINDYLLRTEMYWEKFEGVEPHRRWALAAGAWNAPAFACFIAREEGAAVSVSTTADPGQARETFEEYCSNVSAYYERKV